MYLQPTFIMNTYTLKDILHMTKPDSKTHQYKFPAGTKFRSLVEPGPDNICVLIGHGSDGTRALLTLNDYACVFNSDDCDWFVDDFELIA